MEHFSHALNKVIDLIAHKTDLIITFGFYINSEVAS